MTGDKPAVAPPAKLPDWRNSQTILNAAYYTKLFWDGSSPSLEAQAWSAANGAVAGNGDDAMMEIRLAFAPEYRKAFRQVFGTDYASLENNPLSCSSAAVSRAPTSSSACNSAPLGPSANCDDKS